MLGRPLPARTGSCNCSNEDFGGAQNWRAQEFGVCGVGASLTKVFRMSFRAPEYPVLRSALKTMPVVVESASLVTDTIFPAYILAAL